MSYIKLTFLSIFVSLLIISCEKEQILLTDEQSDDRNGIETIKLLSTDLYVSFHKYIVLYDQSDYLIKTQLSSLMADLYSLTGYSYDSAFFTAANKIIQDASQSDKLIMSDYFDTHRQKYILAHFLGNGKCYILDKTENKPIPEIVKETWADNCGPLCGAGGRKFYIKDKIFLEVIDWISK